MHRLASCASLCIGLLAAACPCMHSDHISLQTQEEHTGLLAQLEIRDDVSRQHRQVDDVLQHRVLVLARCVVDDRIGACLQQGRGSVCWQAGAEQLPFTNSICLEAAAAFPGFAGETPSGWTCKAPLQISTSPQLCRYRLCLLIGHSGQTASGCLEHPLSA